MDVKNVAQQPPGLNLQTLRRLKFWVWFQELTRPTELQFTLIWAGIIGFVVPLVRSHIVSQPASFTKS